MKVVFFGSRHAFDFHHVGGTDSLIRRLARQLVDTYRITVDLVTYGHPKDDCEEHSPGLRSCRYVALAKALRSLTGAEHVVAVYLPPRDRLIWMRYRWQHRGSARFHALFQSWPDSPFRRWLMFQDSRLVPLSGASFAVSPRLVAYARRLGLNTPTLLWPPVPKDYFVPLEAKPLSPRVRVTFLGRVDPGKGVVEVIDLFNALSEHAGIELAFYGMHWPHVPKSVQLHRELQQQFRFPYHHVGFADYTPDVEGMVRDALATTDIFVQPYRRLSSTIDTPLLILEAMASLAVTVTKPYGNIPHIYGSGPSLLPDEQFHARALNLITSAPDWIAAERQRLVTQNARLQFDAEAVAATFVNTIEAK